jgi:hypothetical protein
MRHIRFSEESVITLGFIVAIGSAFGAGLMIAIMLIME